jgi:hypothetical protein
VEAVRAIFAGFAAGYVMGLASLGLSAFYLVRLRQHPWVKRAFPPETNPFLLLVPLSVLFFLAWTALGMVLGAVFHLLESNEPENGLGSPNQAYTGILILLTAALTVPLMPLLRRYRAPVLALAAAFLLIFGYALPYLAV